jgi:FkbM family methyltransferase
MIRYGVAAAVEHTIVLKNLGSLKMVVDIGANRGQFALVVRHCFPQAQIVSFEPLEHPANTFRRVFENDQRVQLIDSALGSESGGADMYVSKQDDSSSLLPITDYQSKLYPGTSESGRLTIRVQRLTDVLTQDDILEPSLLKLDVQGFELQVLAGCEALLSRFEWIYVECSFIELYEGQALADEVIAWLHERGFSLTGVYTMSYDHFGRAIQADFLFKKNKEKPGVSESYV